jgi:hypothetical protein
LIVCFATTIITSMGHCRATKKAKDILRYRSHLFISREFDQCASSSYYVNLNDHGHKTVCFKMLLLIRRVDQVFSLCI